MGSLEELRREKIMQTQGREQRNQLRKSDPRWSVVPRGKPGEESREKEAGTVKAAAAAEGQVASNRKETALETANKRSLVTSMTVATKQ